MRVKVGARIKADEEVTLVIDDTRVTLPRGSLGTVVDLPTMGLRSGLVGIAWDGIEGRPWYSYEHTVTEHYVLGHQPVGFDWHPVTGTGRRCTTCMQPRPEGEASRAV